MEYSFSLDDCGKEFHLSNTSPFRDGMNINIEMVVKAPSGTLMLFHNNADAKYNKYFGDTIIGVKCEAVKAFMEQHRDD